MLDRIEKPMLSKLIEERRGAAVSPLHPEALPTGPTAKRRGRCLYAQAAAAFVFGCELKKGDTWQCAADALRERTCRFVYAWEPSPYPGNRALIERGAIPFPGPVNFSQMAGLWQGAEAEQLSFFDWEAPRPGERKQNRRHAQPRPGAQAAAGQPGFRNVVGLVERALLPGRHARHRHRQNRKRGQESEGGGDPAALFRAPATKASRTESY